MTQRYSKLAGIRPLIIKDQVTSVPRFTARSEIVETVNSRYWNQ